jgi:hypothetical protein
MLIQPITGNQPQKASVTSGIKPLISTTQPVVTKQTTPSAPQVQEVQPKQKKSFLSGVGKFVARTAVNFADMITEGLDFSVNFVANNPIFTTKLTGQTATGGLGSYVTQKITKKQTPFQKQEGEIENKWRNLYAQATKEGKVPTANAKVFIDKIQDTEYIKPSEDWSKAPLKEKLTKRLGETLAVIGPSIIPSFVLYATNPILGVSTTITSTANDVQKQAEQNGVSRDKAEILGLGTGFLVGALDRIVPDELFGASAKNKFIGNLVKRIFTTSLKEAGTEIAQEDIQIAAEATFREDLGWDEIKTRNVMSALGGFLGGAGASTVVGTINNLTKENISIKDEQKVETKVEPNKREVIKLDKETYPGIESGMAVVRPDNTASLDVRFIKDAQGKGQGTKAVTELENKLIDKGITQVKIESFPESVGFWQKQGYQISGDVSEGKNVSMVKELKQPVQSTKGVEVKPAITTKSPQITAKEKVSPTPKEVTTPQAQKEVSPTDKFQSRVFERLKADNPKLEGDLTYDPIKLNEEARKAVNLISKDPQKAFDLAMGKEVSNEVTSTAVNIAMAEKALDEGNNELYAKLIKNRSLAQTRRGQELVSERGSIDDNSTSRYVKELISTRLNEVGKKYLSAVTEKNVTDKERATKIIDRKVTDLELKISRKRLDTKTALKLLDSLECLT